MPSGNPLPRPNSSRDNIRALQGKPLNQRIPTQVGVRVTTVGMGPSFGLTPLAAGSRASQAPVTQLPPPVPLASTEIPAEIPSPVEPVGAGTPLLGSRRSFYPATGGTSRIAFQSLLNAARSQPFVAPKGLSIPFGSSAIRSLSFVHPKGLPGLSRNSLEQIHSFLQQSASTRHPSPPYRPGSPVSPSRDVSLPTHTTLPTVSLSFLFWNFLRMGSLNFGGLRSLLASISALVVEKHSLLTHQDLLDSLTLSTMLPGTVGVQMATLVGYRLRGGVGAWVAAGALLLPAFVWVVGLTFGFMEWRESPTLTKLVWGMIPAFIAVMVNAGLAMSQQALKTRVDIGIAILAGLFLKVFPNHYTPLLVEAAAACMGWVWWGNPNLSSPFGSFKGDQPLVRIPRMGLPPHLGRQLRLVIAAVATAMFFYLFLPLMGFPNLVQLTIVVAGVSLMTFGNGYVLVPLLQSALHQDWMGQDQIFQSLALAQIAPAPIAISATALGFMVQGLMGAIVVTLAILVPPGLVLIGCAPLLTFLKQSLPFQTTLRGIRAAVVGMIFASALTLALSAPPHWSSLLILGVSLLGLWRFQIVVGLLLPLAGLLGLMLYQ